MTYPQPHNWFPGEPGKEIRPQIEEEFSLYHWTLGIPQELHPKSIIPGLSLWLWPPGLRPQHNPGPEPLKEGKKEKKEEGGGGAVEGKKGKGEGEGGREGGGRDLYWEDS